MVTIFRENEKETISERNELERFAREYGETKGLGPLPRGLRGVLAETAKFNLVRYEWSLLQPLIHKMLDECVDELKDSRMQEMGMAKEDDETVVIGPEKPMLDGWSVEETVLELHKLVEDRSEAPFTIQRLCEVLLEPQKQYKDVERLLSALTSILYVSAAHENEKGIGPELPLLSEVLENINENPVSPYTGQSPAPPLPPPHELGEGAMFL